MCKKAVSWNLCLGDDLQVNLYVTIFWSFSIIPNRLKASVDSEGQYSFLSLQYRGQSCRMCSAVCLLRRYWCTSEEILVHCWGDIGAQLRRYWCTAEEISVHSWGDIGAQLKRYWCTPEEMNWLIYLWSACYWKWPTLQNLVFAQEVETSLNLPRVLWCGLCINKCQCVNYGIELSDNN